MCDAGHFGYPHHSMEQQPAQCLDSLSSALSPMSAPLLFALPLLIVPSPLEVSSMLLLSLLSLQPILLSAESVTGKNIDSSILSPSVMCTVGLKVFVSR